MLLSRGLLLPLVWRNLSPMTGAGVNKYKTRIATGQSIADGSLPSRRSFLATSVAVVVSSWIAVDWPAIAQAGELALHTRESVRVGGVANLAVFTDAQVTELEAMVSQIIPSDETPGALEAGVVYFIDRSVATFASARRDRYLQGFEELRKKTLQMFPGSSKFSALSSAQQIQLLSDIETTPFFKTVRDDTVIGMFASPQHGGNYRKAGWKLIGFDDTLNFTPPFGSYD
jgi:gluconate 2-dehydrogenase gamma chain